MFILPKPNHKIEYAFPFTVLGLSIIGLANQTIFNEVNSINYLAIANSLVGITAFILYLKGRKIYAQLFQIWSFSQIIFITSYMNTFTGNHYSEKAIWDTTQVYNMSFFLNLGFSDKNGWQVGINFLGFTYAGLARLVYLSSLSGTPISIRPFKKDSFLSSYLPTTATVQQRVTLSDEKGWLLVKLDKLNPDEKIEYALIKPKEDVTFSPKSKNKTVFFLIVRDPSLIKDDNNKRSDYTTGDWAVVN